MIIVDTLSALTNMEDENDNAKVKKEVIQPLKSLAKKSNSAVLILHHTGKFIEGSPQATDAYKGRGASTFGALSRVVINLKEVRNGNGKAVLSCSKVKGEAFQNIVMQLDQDSRWFKVINDANAQQLLEDETNYGQVVQVVRDHLGIAVKRKTIEDTLANKGINISPATLTRFLKRAVDAKDLLKVHYGHFSVPVNPKTEMPVAE